jgi:polysaccharide deacetylase 2 family uncharacterized protein YibQ
LTSADGGPRRPGGRTALILAWLAALAAGAGLVAYAVVTGPAERPVDDRPRLSMTLPQPAAEAPQAKSAGEPDGDAQDGASTAADGDAAQPAEGPPSDGQPETETAGDPTAAGDSPDGAGGDGGEAEGEATRTAPGDAAGDGATSPPPPPVPSDAPVDLLNGATGAGGTNGDAAQGGGQQTARRTEGDAAVPQLPVASPDAPAWQRYAQRMNPPQGVPKVAIVVRGLGLSSAAAEAAVSRLPSAVSLSFTPYARDRAKAWAAKARRQGHEVLVDLPMEPTDYPAQDPGPRAMMTDLPPAANLDRLDWLLAQVDNEVGVVAAMGSAFLAAPKAVEPVMAALKDRGLMYLDNGVLGDSPAIEIARRVGLPFAVNDRTLDDGQVSRRAIESRLVEAERIAREQGLAVVIAHPYPVSLDLLAGWTDELEQRGFVLVPATFAAIQRAGRNSAQLR